MNNFVKNLQRSRYVFRLDPEAEARVKKDFSIADGETIQAVLDDSAFKNLKQGVVLTDKSIYWNIKNSHTESRSGDTVIKFGGSSSGSSGRSNRIAVSHLETASVFAQNSSSGMVLHIIDEDNWIRIPFKWFENDESLKILFYYYLSKFSRKYDPKYGANEERYAKYLKEHAGRTVSVIPLLYDIFNHAIIAVLLLSMIIPRFFQGKFFAETEKILFLSVVVKLLGIIFRYRKSAYMNSLLIVMISYSLVLPDIFPRVDKLYIWISYAALSTLFSVFDFDRVFKYLVIALVIVSTVALFLQFYLGPLF
jgi:hypothetical protein